LTERQEANVASGLWELPEGWEWCQVEEAVKETERRDPSQFPHQPFTYIDISSIDNKSGAIVADKELLGREAPSRARKVIRTGDVIFATTRPYLRNVALVQDRYDNQICSTGFCVMRADRSIIDPAWVYYLCRSDIILVQIEPKMRGANYPAITDGDVLSALVPLPDTETQRRLVTHIETLLSDVKEARTLLEEMRQDIRDVLEASLAEVFSRSRMESWDNSASLSGLVEITARQVDPRNSEYLYLPHIGVDAIEPRTGRLGSYRSAEEDGVTSSKYSFAPGDLLYAKIRPYLRKAALATFTGLCSADIYPLSIKAEKRHILIPEFLKWSLLSPPFTAYAEVKSARARMPKINRPDLFAYQMSFPDVNEQRQIVSYLEQVQSEVEAADRSLDSDAILVDTLERSILDHAFHGKL
jgi:type I restriction enzyme, S subunit